MTFHPIMSTKDREELDYWWMYIGEDGKQFIWRHLKTGEIHTSDTMVQIYNSEPFMKKDKICLM